jgi:hypothetical protein
LTRSPRERERQLRVDEADEMEGGGGDGEAAKPPELHQARVAWRASDCFD